MDYLGAGESMVTESAFISNKGAGIYTFTPRLLLPEQQAEADEKFNRFIDKLDKLYFEKYGCHSEAYITREAIRNGQK